VVVVIVKNLVLVWWLTSLVVDYVIKIIIKSTDNHVCSYIWIKALYNN